MAKPPKKPAPETSPDLDPTRALDLLRKQLEAGEQLLGLGVVPSDEFSQWKNTSREFIKSAFGPGSSNLTTFNRAGRASAH
jgi:hypothetical protein